jgi:DNA invertase Pin-like site-specific DNA recombinase
VREGEADGIVVYRLDRLARDLVVQEQLLAEVRRSVRDGDGNPVGAAFSTSAAEQAFLDDDPDDPSRKLIRQVLGAVSEFERSMIALRLRNGRKRKHEQGGYAYGRPGYGFAARDGELVPVPEQQAAVERMRELRRRRKTLREIAAALTAEGVPGPTGGTWSATAVQRALNRAGVKTTRRKRRTARQAKGVQS